DPSVILLDGRTSGVSTADKRAIMDILTIAGRKAGVQAIVLVEHDMDLVASYSSRIVALAAGRVLADLPPDRFFADAALIEAVVGKRRRHGCWRWGTLRSISWAAVCCGASRSRSRPASLYASSAAMVPERPRACGPSWGCASRPRDVSNLTAGTLADCVLFSLRAPAS